MCKYATLLFWWELCLAMPYSAYVVMYCCRLHIFTCLGEISPHVLVGHFLTTLFQATSPPTHTSFVNIKITFFALLVLVVNRFFCGRNFLVDWKPIWTCDKFRNHKIWFVWLSGPVGCVSVVEIIVLFSSDYVCDLCHCWVSNVIVIFLTHFYVWNSRILSFLSRKNDVC